MPLTDFSSKTPSDAVFGPDLLLSLTHHIGEKSPNSRQKSDMPLFWVLFDLHETTMGSQGALGGYIITFNHRYGLLAKKFLENT